MNTNNSTNKPFAKGDYQNISADKAYALFNTGGLVLVCTKGADGRYNLAPVAWSCPLDYEPESRILIVLDPAHQTSKNIEDSGHFVLALPTWQQKTLVEQTGSVSARDSDKFEQFAIAYDKADSLDIRVPQGVAAYVECTVLQTIPIGMSVIVTAKITGAKAVADAWQWRLHYAGDNVYYRPDVQNNWSEEPHYPL